jgi:hypothetical protein
MPALHFSELTNNQDFVGIQPNPFSSVTQFVFSLTESAEVSFSVLNVLGAKVCTIPSEFHDAGPGIYTFNGRQLPQGMYLVKFEIKTPGGIKNETRRMLVTR